MKAADEQQVAALRETLKDLPIRPPQDDGLSKSWLVFAALVIVGCIAYFMWPSFMSKPVATASVETPSVAAVAPPVVEAKKAEAPAVVASETKQEGPKATPPAAEPAVTTPPAQTRNVTASAGQFALTVRAKQTTWIRITADGQKVYGGTLDAGQERTLNAKDAELIIGNAGTVEVIYNGQVLSYGNRGEVKTLLMKPDGWKFKPKTQPEASGATAAPPSTGN